MSPGSPAVSSPQPTVLLVDDEESVLLTLQAVLEKEGYKVTPAGSGAEALRALERSSYDLLLTDLRIGDTDGLTLLSAAHRRDPETVAILLTGYASLESAVQALRQGAFNYLLKPCNIDEMKFTLTRGLEKKRLAEALRERVAELEQANQTIQSLNSDLENRVRHATGELAQRVLDLQRSQSQLTAVVDSMQDGLVVFDSEQCVLRANAFMLALFDLPRAGLPGMSAAELAQRTGEPPLVLEGGKALAGDVSFELEGVRRRYIRRIVSPVLVDGKSSQGVVAIYQDLTDQKEVEQLKDDFLSIASHELKTPLTSILGYAQLLNRRLKDSSARDVIGVIEEQCRRMKRLVEDLLDVSRIERGNLETDRHPVDLDELVRRSSDKFRNASTSHPIHLQASGEPIMVWGDSDRLEQVLDNLLSNAIKYSPDGGPVEVTVSRGTDEVTVSVSDCGIGIPADQQERVFSRFYQAESVVRSRRFGGMGLGLFISKTIVEEMGGSIAVDSIIGRGSTFRFTLPLHAAEPLSS